MPSGEPVAHDAAHEKQDQNNCQAIGLEELAHATLPRQPSPGRKISERFSCIAPTAHCGRPEEPTRGYLSSLAILRCAVTVGINPLAKSLSAGVSPEAT